jgi:uncharacterized protein YecT (DUF1311 family)
MRALWLSLLLPGPALAQQVDCATASVQFELNFCAEQDFLAADADLNAAYRAARDMMRQLDAGLPVAERGAEVALRDGQRAWITFRDQACLAEAYVWHGGSGQPMIYSGCQARVTAARAGDLWALAEGY